MARHHPALLKHAGLWGEATSVAEQLRSNAGVTISLTPAMEEVVNMLHKFRKYLRDEQARIKSKGARRGLMRVCVCFGESYIVESATFGLHSHAFVCVVYVGVRCACLRVNVCVLQVCV